MLWYQALAQGQHPDVDFEGNQLPHWMAQMAKKPIAGEISLICFFYFPFVVPLDTLPSCICTHWRLHSSGGCASLVEFRGDWKFIREAFCLRCHWSAKEVCHLCHAKKTTDPVKRNRNLGLNSTNYMINRYRFLVLLIPKISPVFGFESSYRYNPRWTNFARTFERRSPENAVVSCFRPDPRKCDPNKMVLDGSFCNSSWTYPKNPVRLPHPILGLEGFKVEQLRFCSMHICNLGILQNVTAGCITLLCDHRS